MVERRASPAWWRYTAASRAAIDEISRIGSQRRGVGRADPFPPSPFGSGRGTGSPRPLPHHPACGSAPGGSRCIPETAVRIIEALGRAEVWLEDLHDPPALDELVSLDAAEDRQDALRGRGRAVGMARALAEQLASTGYQALSFEERLGLLVDREAQDRENRRFERNLRAAKLRSTACVEDIDFRHPRGLDRAQVLSLAGAQWVAAHQNIVIVGPTGCGKSYLACALAQAAVRAGHTAPYQRVPRLLSDVLGQRAVEE